MSDTENKDSRTKPFGIRTNSGTGTVRQNFSHGRSKSVVVETKRKRIIVSQKTTNSDKKISLDNTTKPNDTNLNSASQQQIDRRKKAIEAARLNEIEQTKAENLLKQQKADEKRSLETLEDNKNDLAKTNNNKETAQKNTEINEELNIPNPSDLPPPIDELIAKPRVKLEPKPENDNLTSQKKLRHNDELKDSRPSKNAVERRRSGKLTINQALSEQTGRQHSIASLKRRQEKEKRRLSGNQQEREKIKRDVQVPDSITVQELANRMAERSASVVKTLMTNGIMATQNQSIDSDTATLIVEEFGHTAIRISASDVEDAIVKDEIELEINMVPRPPVITIMGHVDHGKTSLLDAIRKTNIASGEAGGITQHIGAYQVKTESGSILSFLDTPGHSAFTSMRARGAQVTDIIILVVAADDGVMPQTIEAINHAKAANVPIIVAINKSDKPGADPNKVRTELLQHEIIVESMSGEVLDVEVSAITGKGLENLLENIILQSELAELKANPNRPAEGTVIEAKLDVGRGPVATVLVQKGTLKKGDVFVVGDQWGRVRALVDSKNKRVETATPSVPVEVLGLNGTPEAGDILNVVSNENKAREIADYRHQVIKDKKAALGTSNTLDQMIAKAKADKSISELPLLVKADVQGSTEAIVQALEKINNEEIRIIVLHSGVGAITESDVILAEASKAPIIGFNVRANASARDSANQKSVELRYYSIIYDLVDDVKKAASGLLSPEIKESFIGYAEILEVFKVTGAGKVAGCLITEGSAKRSAGVRLLRENVVIHEGKLKTLKRFKDEVENVQSGQECGMAFEAYEDIRKKDVIEIFSTETISRSLE